MAAAIFVPMSRTAVQRAAAPSSPFASVRISRVTCGSVAGNLLGPRSKGLFHSSRFGSIVRMVKLVVDLLLQGR
jgi:hypothetical protein